MVAFCTEARAHTLNGDEAYLQLCNLLKAYTKTESEDGLHIRRRTGDSVVTGTDGRYTNDVTKASFRKPFIFTFWTCSVIAWARPSRAGR